MQEPLILFGVDVTASRFFQHPTVLKAVAFAAKAHEGQYRKTGEPYVAHCIETALIVEHNIPASVDLQRWGAMCPCGCACMHAWRGGGR